MFAGNDQFPRDERFFNSLFVTFRFVFISVPLKLVFALAVAMLMNQKLKLIPFYRTLYYIPTLLGGSVAIAVLWRRLFAGDGLLNSILHRLFNINAPGVDIQSEVRPLYPDPAGGLAVRVADDHLPRRAQADSAGILRSSSIDGAGKIQQFFTITLPSLSPIIFFNLVMQMISAFQSFTQAFIVSGGSGGPLDSTMFYSLYLYLKGFGFAEMGYASAMAWILLLIIAVLTALTFRASGSLVSYGTGE